MTNQLATRTPEDAAAAAELVRIHVDHETFKRLGAWTDADRFELRARDGAITLDLRAPRLPKELDIELRLERALVKLLLPEGAVVEHRDLRWSGRGRVKDAAKEAAKDARRSTPISPSPIPAGPSGTSAAEAGPVAADVPEGPVHIRLHGTAQRSEIRVHRGGVAQLTALCSREFIEEALRARKAGTYPTI